MKPNKSTVISFRLTEEEFRPYAMLLDKSTMSRSEFFRTIFLEHKIDLVLKEKGSPDYKKCLFYYNKTSNNLNQLTKQINKSVLAGTITQLQYMKLLNTLIDIRELLKGGLDAGKS
ncbi:plasmid mobilization protein [Enterobacter cancerogenus]|nr:relaxosome protein [Salmonella enterica]ECH4042275.1 relaxosome protein [Salmonella enterica]